jgi:hypothetical protein
MRGEGIPLAVEQDAAEMQYEFSTLASPSHPRAIQTDGDQVPDRTLDSAGSNVEPLSPEFFVAQASRVLLEVEEDLLDALSAGLAPRPRGTAA